MHFDLLRVCSRGPIIVWNSWTQEHFNSQLVYRLGGAQYHLVVTLCLLSFKVQFCAMSSTISI